MRGLHLYLQHYGNQSSRFRFLYSALFPLTSEIYPDFALIGRAPTLLSSHWLKASKFWNIFTVLLHQLTVKGFTTKFSLWGYVTLKLCWFFMAEDSWRSNIRLDISRLCSHWSSSYIAELSLVELLHCLALIGRAPTLLSSHWSSSYIAELSLVESVKVFKYFHSGFTTKFSCFFIGEFHPKAELVLYGII